MKKFNWDDLKGNVAISIANEEEALDFIEKTGMSKELVLRQLYGTTVHSLTPAFTGVAGCSTDTWYKERGFTVIPWSSYMPVVIDFKQVRDFIGRMLAFSYDYDEALQFGVLAHDLYMEKGIEIDVPVEGKDFTLTEEATKAVRKFFDLCEKEEHSVYVYKYFVDVFYNATQK